MGIRDRRKTAQKVPTQTAAVKLVGQTAEDHLYDATEERNLFSFVAEYYDRRYMWLHSVSMMLVAFVSISSACWADSSAFIPYLGGLRSNELKNITLSTFAGIALLIEKFLSHF